MLVTGDLVQDDPAGYPHFRRLFGSLGVPVLCLPGNHDEPRAMRRELAGEPFVLGGFVDLGRWRIVLLDSCIPGAAERRPERRRGWPSSIRRSPPPTGVTAWCACTITRCRCRAAGSIASA